MAESIRFNDKYIDTTGIYDSTQKETQQAINADVSDKFTVKTVTGWSINSTYISKNEVTVLRCGSLVIVSFLLYAKSEIPGGGTHVIDGLPASVAEEYVIANGSTNYYHGNDHLRTNSAVSTGYSMGQFAYFTSD